jgi:hypothetical protein
MKHASYRAGVAWIARNVTTRPVTHDLLLHPMDAFGVAGCVAVGLLADLFGVDALRVAGEVLREWGPGVKREGEKAVRP